MMAARVGCRAFFERARSAEFAGGGQRDQPIPQAGLTQQLAASFDECGVRGIPDIRELGGRDYPVAIDLPGEEFGVQAGLQHRLGLATVFIAQDVDQGHRAERLGSGFAGLQTSLGGFDEGLEVGEVDLVGGRRRIPVDGFDLVERPGKGGDQADDAEHHNEDGEARTGESQQEGQTDDDGEKDQEDDPGDEIGFGVAAHSASPPRSATANETRARAGEMKAAAV